MRLRPPLVRTANAYTQTLTLCLAASGLVEARSTDLSPPLPGRVTRLCVEEGDRMAASDALARVAPFNAPLAGARGETLVTPLDGTVVDIYARTGALVKPGHPVLRVVAAEGLWVTAFVKG